jgi:hypothetical protein
MKPLAERPTGRDRIRGEDKIKMYLKYGFRGSRMNGRWTELVAQNPSNAEVWYFPMAQKPLVG